MNTTLYRAECQLVIDGSWGLTSEWTSDIVEARLRQQRWRQLGYNTRIIECPAMANDPSCEAEPF